MPFEACAPSVKYPGDDCKLFSVFKLKFHFVSYCNLILYADYYTVYCSSARVGWLWPRYAYAMPDQVVGVAAKCTTRVPNVSTALEVSKQLATFTLYVPVSRLIDEIPLTHQ
jgi:hypothetical protein